MLPSENQRIITCSECYHYHGSCHHPNNVKPNLIGGKGIVDRSCYGIRYDLMKEKPVCDWYEPSLKKRMESKIIQIFGL